MAEAKTADDQRTTVGFILKTIAALDDSGIDKAQEDSLHQLQNDQSTLITKMCRELIKYHKKEIARLKRIRKRRSVYHYSHNSVVRRR